MRLTPASTFKIANSLIALETRTITDIHQTLRVDLEKYPAQDWWQPGWATETYDLRGAFQNSVFPIYRSIASNIGEADMTRYLSIFNYGNQDISSGIDDFWVAGSLEISAIEQVEFLRSLLHGDFGLAESTLNDLKEIMTVEDDSTYSFYAKTGAALVEDMRVIYWYVGFVENENGIHYFALNLDAPPTPENAQLRIDLSRNYLRQFGVL